MVSGSGFALGSLAGSEASGSGRIMGVETSVHNELAEVGGFAKNDRGRFSEEVLG